MKRLLPLLLLCSCALFLGSRYESAAVLRKGFFSIPSKSEMSLGEFELTGFRVTVVNTSRSNLQLIEINRNSDRIVEGWALLPGGRASVKVNKSSKLVIQNLSEKEIDVQVNISHPKIFPSYHHVKTYQFH